MFFLTSKKLVLYVPKCFYEIQDFYKVDLKYVSCNGFQIDDCRYLVWKQESSNDLRLSFFLVHDVESTEENKYRLYLQPYQTLTDQSELEFWFKQFNVGNRKRSQLIDIGNFSSMTKFQPFMTATLVEENFMNSQAAPNTEELSQAITESIRDSFYRQNNIELKNKTSLILKNRQISDNECQLVVKKGIEFSTESNGSQTWVNFKFTHFSRSYHSIADLDLNEPIDHKQNRIVNIVTGSQLSKRVKTKSEVNFIENCYLTFNTSQAADRQFNNYRFSQEKFYFEQTNLGQTVELIEELKTLGKFKPSAINFESLNNLSYCQKIIHRHKKFVCSEGKTFYTAQKGLYHAGVLQKPIHLQVGVIIPQNTLENYQLNRVAEQVNKRLDFLYKEAVAKVEKKDIIIFDYNNFNGLEQIDPDLCYLCVLVKPSAKRLSFATSEKINKVNQELKQQLKDERIVFRIINEIQDEFTVANALLNLGCKREAIPWKIDQIDPEDTDHIFIGIDLGHDSKKKQSKLTFVAVDNQGLFIDSYRQNHLRLKEQISDEVLEKCLRGLLKKVRNKINRENLNLTLHRDGIFSEKDRVQTILQELGVANFNLVEIVKSGNPVIGFKSTVNGKDRYLDSFEGHSIFLDDDLSYLVTNDQSLSKNTAPEPIRIKKISGNKNIQQLTEEIYWLTHCYSVNIFQATKLPITLELANNLSYTKDMIHFSTS
ncbi:hypothetical protein ACL6C3_02000 [Capilliphycus salinus ALCB114379]|uniref:hypothetical protein n=1 Tax=Capilliphycus salinus TaxID=2768948 RepID=UPI0039A515CB